MTGPFADRLFRIAFALAGFYNLAFGLWASVWPRAFFELFDISPPRYPGIWACLGMVVGVYGLLYLHAAWKLESAKPIIAVGLLGKVLGLIGMAMSFDDDWPRRLGMICVYNDLIWWLPFGLFLVRGTALGRRLVAWAPWICAVAHAAAFVTLPILLRPGMLTESDPRLRAAYISQNAMAWSIGWSSWMLAAMTLVGFYAWWGSKLAGSSSTGRRPVQNRCHRQTAVLEKCHRPAACATAAVLIAAVGMVFDFSGESLLTLVLVEFARDMQMVAFSTVERAFTLLSAAAANGLYTLGGMLLTLATPDLPRWVRSMMWATWVAGALMTIAGVLNHVGGMVSSTVVLFPLLLAWTIWMTTKWQTTNA